MFERLLFSLSSFQVMFVGPEIASRLRRHSAELSEAIARSRPPRDESGDLQEVVSVGGVVRLQSPYWWVFFSSLSSFEYLFQDLQVRSLLQPCCGSSSSA